VSRRIFVSAGEPSGDLHGAPVVRALRERFPDAVIEAFGGRQMATAGATVLFPMERYTVMGFAEIVSKIPAHYRLLRAIERRFQAGEYDLALLIDYPGFHLRVAERARRAGVKVLYYIAPQLWAWRPGRARRLAGAIDRLAVILPFEERFFPSVGLPAEFVGHPLVDRGPWPDRIGSRRALRVPAEAKVLGIFPGSRPQEIERLWPAFRDAAMRLLRDRRCDRAIVAGTAGGSYPGAAEGDLTIVRGDPIQVFAAADAALAKSGTTTLEAALCDTPMVVAYRVHPLTSFFARRVMRVPWISLVNLVAGEELVPELLQRDVTPARLAAELAPLLDPAHPTTARQREGLRRVRELLGGPGAARRVAGMAAELMA